MTAPAVVAPDGTEMTVATGMDVPDIAPERVPAMTVETNASVPVLTLPMVVHFCCGHETLTHSSDLASDAFPSSLKEMLMFMASV